MAKHEAPHPELVSDYSTGISGLDELFNWVEYGDNIVFQVDDVADYTLFLKPYMHFAHETGKKIIYFRFGQHKSLIRSAIGKNYEVEMIELEPEAGFCTFIDHIFEVVNRSGEDVYYIFDLLTDLTVDWYSDEMLGNFFRLVCPYLRKIKCVAYFSLMKYHNAPRSIQLIHKTAQIVLNVYRVDAAVYIHPIKAENRDSPTMYTLHEWIDCPTADSEFEVIAESGIVTKILSKTSFAELNFTIRRIDTWFSTLKQANEELAKKNVGQGSYVLLNQLKDKLVRMLFPEDTRIRQLALDYVDLATLVSIGQRMIGTGRIGGKSAGMLIARAIISKMAPSVSKRVELHDSFYLGSDLYYSFIILNDIWWDRDRLSNPNTFLDNVEATQLKICQGTFPPYIIHQFEEMLEYYGQSPIIVRSSSVQEDAFGNAFSGKYDSLFLANQGNPQDRLDAFIEAVRKIYASTISKDALLYRKERGILHVAEEMALLIQRVSGRDYQRIFLPDASGVGFSYNPFAWNKRIDHNAGFIRFVLGLGTRAVGRIDDDYTRLVALNVPKLKISNSMEYLRQFSQKKVDIIDIERNSFRIIPFEELLTYQTSIDFDLFTTIDRENRSSSPQDPSQIKEERLLTLDPVIEAGSFVQTMQLLLNTLEDTYAYPVDLEFTVNFRDKDHFMINILQCRPFQVKRDTINVDTPANLSPDSIIISSSRSVIGTARTIPLNYIILVKASGYVKLKEYEKYEVAQIIGSINQQIDSKTQNTLLMGPGRWGSSHADLGVPVSFSHISHMTILAELAEMHDIIIPDVSLGTHFFNDLVEMDMAYFAIFPPRKSSQVVDGAISQNSEKILPKFDREFIEGSPNLLNQFGEYNDKWEAVIHVIDATKENLFFHTSSLKQLAVCFKNLI